MNGSSEYQDDRDQSLVYVVDDDAGVRDALGTLLGSVSLRSRGFADARSLLEALDETRPGCLIVDLRMPGMNGLELQRALHRQKSRVPVIFLSAHGNVKAAVHAMQTGAYDFLTKPFDDDILLTQVQNALNRDEDRLAEDYEMARLEARFAGLTAREREVLQGVTAGRANKEIADDLGVSPKTVELHRGHMMHKLGAESVAELVRMHLRVAGERRQRQAIRASLISA